PDLIAAWTNRAAVKRDRGDLPGALADLNKSLELNPKSDKNLMTRSDLKKTMGDAAGAEIDRQTAFKLNPRLAAAYAEVERLKPHKLTASNRKPTPPAQNALLLRTDFSDDNAWESLIASIEKSGDEFKANVEFISDREYADMEPGELPSLAKDTAF